MLLTELSVNPECRRRLKPPEHRGGGDARRDHGAAHRTPARDCTAGHACRWASAAPNPTSPSDWPGWACPVTWISRVGDDAFGALITREIRAEGVRVHRRQDPDAPTGLMVKEHRGGTPWRVRYYRSNSAAAQLTPADLDETAIADARRAAPDRNHPGARPRPAADGPAGHRDRPRSRHSRVVRRELPIDALVGRTRRPACWPSCRSGVDLLFAGPRGGRPAPRRNQRPLRHTSFEDGENLGPGTGQTGTVHRRGQTRRTRLPRRRRRRNVPGVHPAGHRRRRRRCRRRVRRRLPQRTRRRGGRRRNVCGMGNMLGGAVCQQSAATGKACPPGKNSTTRLSPVRSSGDHHSSTAEMRITMPENPADQMPHRSRRCPPRRCRRDPARARHCSPAASTSPRSPCAQSAGLGAIAALAQLCPTCMSAPGPC